MGKSRDGPRSWFTVCAPCATPFSLELLRSSVWSSSSWPNQTQPGRAVSQERLLGVTPSCEPRGPRVRKSPCGEVLMLLYDSGPLIFAGESRKKSPQDKKSKIMHRRSADSKLSTKRCTSWLKKRRKCKAGSRFWAPPHIC